MGFDSRLFHLQTLVKSRVSEVEKMAGIPKGIPNFIFMMKNYERRTFEWCYFK